MNRLFFILLVLIVFTACGKKNDSTTLDSKQVSPENKTADDGPLKLSEKKFFTSYNGCKTSDTCTYFQVDYLEAVSGKNRDKINKLIMNEVNAGITIGENTPASIQAAADSFMTSYVSFRKEVPESAQFWYLEYSLSQEIETQKIISLASGVSSFMGGAHPNTYVSFLNINKETGDTISLGDLFAAGYEPKLNKMIDAEYRKMKNLKKDDDLQEKGDLFENKIGYNYNFTPTKDGGITFYYNPYEIAAYVFGPIEITLTKNDLAEILSPTSLLVQ
jgi:hypothetical protein